MSELSIPWRDVEVGMTVELPSGAYTVTRAKTKGKTTTATVRGEKGRFTRELRAKDLVTIARKAPLHDERGQMQRWADRKEHEKALGSSWDKPTDKAEKTILKSLPGSRLVGVTKDGDNWLVPDVDPSTIAAHLYLFHDIEAVGIPFEDLWAMHEDNHARALTAPFTELHIRHTHTPERPTL